MENVNALYWLNGEFCEMTGVSSETAAGWIALLGRIGVDVVVIPYIGENEEEGEDDNDVERWEKGEDDEIPFWHPSHGY